MLAPQQPIPSAISAPGSTPQAALLLDAGDLIELSVFDTPELSGKLRVDDAGQITLPVGGAITLKGLTAEQAQQAIEQRFQSEKILREPHVEVLVLEYATQGVTVAGEVKLPGVYPWTGKHTVLDFISIAGGLTPAAWHQVIITRKGAAAPAETVTLGGPFQQPERRAGAAGGSHRGAARGSGLRGRRRRTPRRIPG